MPFSIGTIGFIVSTLGVPLSYGFNRLLTETETTTPLTITVLALVLLVAIGFLVLWLTRGYMRSQMPEERFSFCVFTVVAFMSVVSLITGLELDGLINGFVNRFLKHCEPHLRSSFGVMTCYWSGTGAYGMCLMMLAAITYSTEYYEVSLYWLGSTVNSMLVLLLGIMSGKQGPTWGSVLYLPFVFIPPLVVSQLNKYQNAADNRKIVLKESIWRRPRDLWLVVCLLLSIAVCLLRGVAVLGTQISVCRQYIERVEPYLLAGDPAPFPKIQMLIYLFYFIPYYATAIYALVSPAPCLWAVDISLIYAGAAIQAQFAHIGSSVHSRTPYIQRVPPDLDAQAIFWLVNLTLAIGPQLLAQRWQEMKEQHLSLPANCSLQSRRESKGIKSQ